MEGQMVKKKVSMDQASATPLSQGPRPRLHKLKISNFRCIGPEPVEIELDDIVVLVGPNNTGKSSILRAYEVAMEQGSSQGELKLDDFPNGKVDPQREPTIEIETVVFEKTAPGDRWVRTDPSTNEMFVREKWTWTAPGPPKKVGWDVAADDWHQNEGPWGAPNVAQAYRPLPHRVGAFQKLEEQAEEVVKLLSKAITDRVKELSKRKSDEDGSGGPTEFEQLLLSIKDLRCAIASEATAAVADVQNDLAAMINDVFPGYSVTFDARPEDDIEKALTIYKPDPLLKMGPTDGFHSTLDRQGSGTCRTLIWAALRILSERIGGKSTSSTGRPHLLLMDEPEICLHPDAIREACRVLYDLPKTKNWQVMITTHSPIFIDLSRDNTSIARVERLPNGTIKGTTIFRPKRANLDDDDRTELKLLNLCDPYVAEFFFCGRTVLVEGDTEYTAFKHIVSQDPSKYKDIHIVRARGKACLTSLCKILNHFENGYAILHDADREKILGKKTKKARINPAWTENHKILKVTGPGRDAARIRLLASVPNFEEAFLGEEADGDKPYSALARLKKDANAFSKIADLLNSLIDRAKPVPLGAKEWTSIDDLRAAVLAFDGEDAIGVTSA
jgi:putative ATP-dependent endonuclease of the OLD family